MDSNMKNVSHVDDEPVIDFSALKVPEAGDALQHSGVIKHQEDTDAIGAGDTGLDLLNTEKDLTDLNDSEERKKFEKEKYGGKHVARKADMTILFSADTVEELTVLVNAKFGNDYRREIQFDRIYREDEICREPNLL